MSTFVTSSIATASDKHWVRRPG